MRLGLFLFIAGGILSSSPAISGEVQALVHLDEATYTWIHENIIVPKCTTCHFHKGNLSTYEGVKGYVWLDTTHTQGEIDPTMSSFYSSVATPDASMPPDCGAKPETCLTQEEQDAIYYWIKQGAENK